MPASATDVIYSGVATVYRQVEVVYSPNLKYRNDARQGLPICRVYCHVQLSAKDHTREAVVG